MGMLLRRHHENKEAEQSADLPVMTEENEEITKHPTEDVVGEISDKSKEEISDEAEETGEASEEVKPDKKMGKKTAGGKSGKK